MFNVNPRCALYCRSAIDIAGVLRSPGSEQPCRLMCKSAWPKTAKLVKQATSYVLGRAFGMILMTQRTAPILRLLFWPICGLIGVVSIYGASVPRAMVQTKVLQGGPSFTQGASSNAVSGAVFSSNIDPRRFRPEMMPTVGRNECIPPDPRWILSKRIGNECYYLEPITAPPGGVLVRFNLARNFSTCAPDAFNSRLLVCWGPIRGGENWPGPSAGPAGPTGTATPSTSYGRPTADPNIPRNPEKPTTACPGLVAQARASRAAIDAGTPGPGPLISLTKVLQQCSPAFPRPINCFDMMVDAASKRQANPSYSQGRAREAVECYERAEAYPLLQQASEFSNHMRLAAEAILQAAGQIAKANIDAMDVTKHNNVGIGVAFGSYFGALAATLGAVARQYQALATVGPVAAQENVILPIAAQAASESQAMAAQATKTVAELDAAAPAAYGTGSGTPAGSAGYLEDSEILNAAGPKTIRQGKLPTCTVLSCHRLANLLDRNISIFEVFNKIRPRIITKMNQDGKFVITGGLNAEQVSSPLQSLGIQAKVGTGLTNLMNEVRAGSSLIFAVNSLMGRALHNDRCTFLELSLEFAS